MLLLLCVVLCCCCVFFFFQAEDGIRDLVRSRGLGDVYKRQREGRVQWRSLEEEHRRGGKAKPACFGFRSEAERCEARGVGNAAGAVSYTHLTLPTSDLV